ncbi:MAG: YgiT-type zinc finger protein [Caldilineaceae bacterium]
MTDEQAICPICGSNLSEKVIDYSDWNGGHLLVVRSVPVRECEENGHRFFQAKVACSLEKLFQADQSGQLRPVAVMQVPVADFVLTT